MKVSRLISAGNIQLFEEPKPTAKPGQVLVNIRSVGICGSDLHWFSEAGIGDAKLDRALVLGHEAAGITEDGIRVAIEPALPCGECEYCQKGHPNLCPDVKFLGHGAYDGTLQEQIAWDASCMFPIPDTMTFDEAAMLEPLGVAIHTVDLAHLKPGMTVAILGAGPIGLLILQLVIKIGAIPLFVTDRLEHRTMAAKKYGAIQALTVSSSIPPKEISTMTNDIGVDVVFDASGHADAITDAFNAVKPGGKVILAGIPDDDRTSFTASIARRKGVTIKLVRRMKHTYPRAIDLVHTKQIDVNGVVSSVFSLDQAKTAFEVASRRDGLKVIIHI